MNELETEKWIVTQVRLNVIASILYLTPMFLGSFIGCGPLSFCGDNVPSVTEKVLTYVVTVFTFAFMILSIAAFVIGIIVVKSNVYKKKFTAWFLLLYSTVLFLVTVSFAPFLFVMF